MNLNTRMEKMINTGYKNIRGLMVLKDGQTVYENYYSGHCAENTLHIFSATKSILSILFGIAIEQGYIKNIDEKILSYFPDYSIVRGERTLQNITLRDMLTMTVPYKCKVEPFAKVFESNDWITPALDIMGGKGRVGDFRYSPMIGVHVLSGVLSNAIGGPVLDYANKNLFLPIGIEGVQNIVLHCKEDFTKVQDERTIGGWVQDPQKYNTAGWGLILKTSDMARIGQLYLNDGNWQGRQIVPARWVEESTTEHSRFGVMPYGYLWWIINAQEHSYAAMGQAGNLIYVNKKTGIVVAISAVDARNAKDTVKLVRDYVEPVFVD